jgi:mannose-1-phosphate guanylyltransferase/mannose-6-phosphate isomerase
LKVKVYPVIMSGGAGSRLWPLSTDARPKPHHALVGPRTMMEDTALRMRGIHGDIQFMDPVVIAGEGHRELVKTDLARVGVTPAALVFEPMGRNTAATAALAAMVVSELDPDALALLMPADHVVTNPQALIAAVAAAATVARDHIVTFGMTPTEPNTGYGYIRQASEALAPGVYPIAEFKEKPTREIAEAYLAAGGYSWNGGVFFFHPQVMLDEFSHTSSDIREGARQAYAGGQRSGIEVLLDGKAFAAVREAPVDIAVMEQTRRAAVAPCAIGWADVGSWSEVWRLSGGQEDARANVTSGPVHILDGEGNLILSSGVHVSIAGVDNLVVIATDDGILILPKDRSQDVKKLIPKKG